MGYSNYIYSLSTWKAKIGKLSASPNQKDFQDLADGRKRSIQRYKEVMETMDKTEQTDLDNWDEYMGKWIKADMVATVPAKFIVIRVRSETFADDRKQIVLTINYNSKKFDFSLNNPNMKFLKEEAKIMPKNLVNKTLTIVKDKVYNPRENRRVDSLFIDKVE